MQHNIAHALCVLCSQGCRKTLRVCNTSCFCMAKMDTPTRLHVVFVSTLSVLLTLKLVKEIFTPLEKSVDNYLRRSLLLLGVHPEFFTGGKKGV